MKKLIYLLLLLLSGSLLASLLVACDEDEDCSATARQMMWCGIYRIEEGETPKVLKDTIPFLTVSARDTDSTLINKQEKVTQLDLPLRYTEETTIFVFAYSDSDSDTEKDTIRVKHTNSPYFISLDCGYQMRQSISEVSHTKHRLDSIHLSRNDANNNGTENIKLFYKR